MLANKSRIGLVQICSVFDKELNFNVNKKLIAEASNKGCSMIFFPECFAFMGKTQADAQKYGESLEGDLFKSYMSLCKEHKIWASFGGFNEYTPDKSKVYNSHVIVNDQGEITDLYRKIHLCDMTVTRKDGKKLNIWESKSTEAGKKIVVTKNIPSLGNQSVGLSICYDIRFPELYNAMKLKNKKLSAFIIPAAFTKTTGELGHWHILNKARAIDNQSFVISAAQVGAHNDKRESYGHSLVIDPWGKILKEIVPPTSSKNVNVVEAVDIDWKAGQTFSKAIPVIEHKKLNSENLFPEFWEKE